MKKLLFLLTFVLLTSFNNISESPYCEGWESGYCEGWRDVKGEFAICPITPICPIPEINRVRYQDGYNRGFKSGRSAAKR